MRTFTKAGVAAAAAGIAVFGTVAAGGGVANAATNQAVTGCTVNSGVLNAGVFPTCTAPDSTVINPTSITVTANPNFFSVLDGLGSVLQPVLTLLNQQLAETITYTLSCSVDGTTVTKAETFTATSATASQSQTISLQNAVGSPVPNSCTVEDLKGTALISLSSSLLTILNVDFSLGATAYADAGVSGAIYSPAGKLSSGLTGNICADDTGNGNAGAPVQVYQCNSDLAQYWIQASTGQLVRNGDCLAQDGSKVKLETCSANTAQVWAVKGTDGSTGEIINEATGDCLTWPKAVSFTQLSGGTCTGGASQMWAAPAKSPMEPATT